MAKWGEGDPRWIVEERPDATNVNNWHWYAPVYLDVAFLSIVVIRFVRFLDGSTGPRKTPRHGPKRRSKSSFLT